MAYIYSVAANILNKNSIVLRNTSMWGDGWCGLGDSDMSA